MSRREIAETTPIVRVDRFIQATRESGYHGTVHAVAELVDNSIEAGATRVWITIHGRPGRADGLSVMDNGCGMTKGVLAEALQFGGSTRFGRREGLGRFGMGLPNASLSQARRLDVFSWRRRRPVLHTFIDLDEVAEGRVKALHPVSAADRRSLDCEPEHLPPSGTLVRWSKADRFDSKRVRTIERKLQVGLGRIFRHQIWSGVSIQINGERVTPVDPLFLHEDSLTTGGHLAEEWAIEFRPDPSQDAVGLIHVRFSLLPTEKWHGLTIKEKRAKGIVDGAGVSIVRAGREIDYGWFFLSGKRRQSYDDWWRCEIAFDPILDEAFGITHTKQQVRPRADLNEILTPMIVDTAKALHADVRARYKSTKQGAESTTIEDRAAERDATLPPLPKPKVPRALEGHPLLGDVVRGTTSTPAYRIAEAELDEGHFFTPVHTSGAVIAALNPSHPFHRLVYSPLRKKRSQDRAMDGLKALMLSAARAEAMLADQVEQEVLRAFRRHWSDALREFLR